jgi:membrane-associated phospholipid phosphatase
MNNTKLSSLEIHSALDVVCSMFLLVLAAVAVVFHARIPHWETTAFELLGAAAAFVVVRRIIRIVPQGIFSDLLQTASILGLFVFVFAKMNDLQLAIIPRWMDDILVGWEMSLFGTESTLALDRIVNPVLTEWMMFAYVIYVPLLWGMGLICHYAGGQEAITDYLANLSLMNIVCCIGFLLFPIASPLFYMPEAYSHALTGGLFSGCGEWIRHNVHFPGASLPSMHCANATVMLAMLYRYKRRLYYVALPTIITLYVSTVYGRYHYSLDAVTGILSAFLVLRFSTTVISATQLARASVGRLFEPRGVPESVSE